MSKLRHRSERSQKAPSLDKPGRALSFGSVSLAGVWAYKVSANTCGSQMAASVPFPPLCPVAIEALEAGGAL